MHEQARGRRSGNLDAVTRVALATFLFSIVSGSILTRKIPLPIAACVVLILFAIFMVTTLPWRKQIDFKPEDRFGFFWLTVFSFLLVFFSMIQIMLMGADLSLLSSSRLNSFATPLGVLLFSVLRIISPNSASRIGPYCFFIVVFHGVIEFIGFNFLPSVGPFNWYYQAYPANDMYIAVGQNSLGLYRFWGAFGFHPGTSVLALSMIAVVLDNARSSYFYRVIAGMMAILSFSGVGLLSGLCVLLSICLQSPWITRLGVQLKLALLSFLLIAAVFLIFSLDDFIDGSATHLSRDYLAYLIELKFDQIQIAVSSFNEIGIQAYLGGLIGSRNLPYVRYINLNAATDFGILNRFAIGGVVGLFLYGLQNYMTLKLGNRSIRSIEQRFVLIMLTILAMFHYSVFNVLFASLTISISLAAEYRCCQTRAELSEKKRIYSDWNSTPKIEVPAS